MRRLRFLFVLIILIQSCKQEEVVPKGFGFRIEDDVSIINSFDSSYTRKYNFKDIVVKLAFSKEDLNQIYHEVIKSRVDNHPTNVKPPCYRHSVPMVITNMRIQINGKKSEIEFVENCELEFYKFLQKNRIKRIEKSIGKVSEVISSKDEIRNLPPSNLIFK